MPLFAVPSVKSNSLGLLAGLCAFLIWGFLVVFWHMLDAVAPFEILCYRIIFSFVSLLPVVMLTRRWAEVVSAFRNRRVALTMFASSCVVGLNWFLYIWAISTGQILETSLGYYTNPLMNVLFGFLFLRERPSRLQGIAILLACIGVLLSFLGHNQFPWLALSLAFTFALYGFIRKTVSVEALPGLFIETIVLIPFSFLSGWPCCCIRWKAGGRRGICRTEGTEKGGAPPSLFCTVERMGIWTEMVRLSWAPCRKNSQYGNFHAYVYL